MKDIHRSQYVHGVPPCPLSVQCLYLLDALDECDVMEWGQADRVVDHQKNKPALSEQDEQLVAQLCAHLPTCLACSLTLARARRIREHQRRAIRGWLAEEALQVPSTVSRILAATTRSQSSQHASTQANTPVTEPAAVLSTPVTPDSLPAIGRRKNQRVWRLVLTIAAVLVVVVGSALLFAQMALYRNSVPAATPPLSLKNTTTTPASSVSLENWHSVLIASSSAALGTTLMNYDTRNNKAKNLVAKALPAGAVLDGIAHDGNNVLYHFKYADGNTTYWTLNKLAKHGYFYAVPGGGNALWLPDNRSVLISVTGDGLRKVDTRTGAAVKLLAGMNLGQLEFYREPFVYFLSTDNLERGALYRIDIRGGAPQQVTEKSPGSTFWLSPDGTKVYYAYEGTANPPGVYAASSDGSRTQRISLSGVPIGYARDNTLMLMRLSGGKFQVVRADVQEKVVMSDVAPGAVSLCDGAVAAGQVPICDSSIALAPLGETLVVEAGYGGGGYNVFVINMQTGKRSLLSVSAGLAGTRLQMIGWNRMLQQ